MDDHHREQKLLQLLACNSSVHQDRIYCFEDLLRLLNDWPPGPRREHALRRAEEALASWPSSQRATHLERVLSRDFSSARDTARLVRVLLDTYPDDTDRNDNRSAYAVFPSEHFRALESYTAVRASVDFTALARGPGLASLRALSLNECYFHANWHALAAWSSRATLRELTLGTGGWGRDDFWTFAADLPALEGLSLSGGSGGFALEQLRLRPGLQAQLRELALAGTWLRDSDLVTLTALERLSLARLDLRGNLDLTPDAVDRVRRAPRFARTEVLAGPFRQTKR